jgi:integrase
MTASTQAISPLRQRMLDDMRMRKLRPRTQTGYIRAVRYLAAFLQRSPDTATAEDLRRFQLHLVDRGVSAITINATITALRFFFDVTLGRDDVMAKMTYVRVPQKLPVVLSRDEAVRLIAAASWEAMCCAARVADTTRSPTTHAATGIARSARPARQDAGWMPGMPICCRWSTTTSSSPCRHRSAPSPTTTRPRSIPC